MRRIRRGLSSPDDAVREVARRDRSRLLDGPLPLFESSARGSEIVSFLYEDSSASEVLLAANRLTDESDLSGTLLEKLPGTHVWAASFRVPAGWTASYSFVVAQGEGPSPWDSCAGHADLRAVLDAGAPDPRNPRATPGRDGRIMSLAESPSAGAPAFPLVYDAGRRAEWHLAPRGHRVAFESIGPAAPSDPMLVVFDGEIWLAHGLLDGLTAAHCAGRLDPLHVVLFHSGGRERRWETLGGHWPIADVLADSVLPWIRERRGLEAGVVGAVGQSLGGLAALSCTIERPDVFTRAISQSASLWVPRPFTALTALASRGLRDRLVGTSFHIEVGSMEWSLTGPHQDLVAELERAGATVRARHIQGGHDYAWWRKTIVEGIADVFTEERTSES